MVLTLLVHETVHFFQLLLILYSEQNIQERSFWINVALVFLTMPSVFAFRGLRSGVSSPKRWVKGACFAISVVLSLAIIAACLFIICLEASNISNSESKEIVLMCIAYILVDAFAMQTLYAILFTVKDLVFTSRKKEKVSPRHN
jgi:hypothetical protein